MLSPDGSLAAVMEQGAYYVWRTAPKTRIVRLESTNIFTLGMFSAGALVFVSADSQSQIRVWDLTTGSIRWRITCLDAVVHAVSPDGMWIAASEYSAGQYPAMTVYNRDSGAAYVRCGVGKVTYCVFSPNSLLVAWAEDTACNVACIGARDLGKHDRTKAFWCLPYGMGLIHQCAFSPDARLITVMSGTHGTTWNLAYWSQWESCEPDCLAVSYSADGRLRFVRGCKGVRIVRVIDEQRVAAHYVTAGRAGRARPHAKTPHSAASRDLTTIVDMYRGQHNIHVSVWIEAAVMLLVLAARRRAARPPPPEVWALITGNASI